MNPQDRRQLLGGIRVTSLGTLLSRVLGLLRDVATAALLGLAGGGAMDAFVVAFRIPNLFRRLLGEGALAASYLPVLSAQMERDRRAAWQLVSSVLVVLSVVLSAVVVCGEAVCAILYVLAGRGTNAALVIGLTAVLLPYLLFICLAAQLAATLHALGRFGAAALSPALLNIIWLAAAALIAPRLASPEAKVYVLAAAVLLAGVVQLAWHVPVLWALGFRFQWHWPASRRAVWGIAAAMAPLALGLAATQMNTFVDSLLAWGLARGPGDAATIGWLPGNVAYPLEQGAAAAIWYGERMYHFPVGILGLATATAVFPLLSRHAARGDQAAIRRDMTLGLRLVLFLGIPAAAGLAILAEPIVALLFERGAFTHHDTLRTSRVIVAYAGGIWAFCALPVIVRGFYAVGDRIAPLRVALGAVALNMTLNVALVWPLAERGLALSTALGASVQVVVLAIVFSRRHGGLDWAQLGETVTRTLASTLVMAAFGIAVLGLMPQGGGSADRLLRLAIPLAGCLGVFLGTAWLLNQSEVAALWGRRRDLETSPSDQ